MRSDNRTISLILGEDELAKIDNLAGEGKRSSYIRCLVQKAAGGIELKLMDLQTENKHLYSLLHDERAIIRQLRERLAKREEKKEDKFDEELAAASVEYQLWRDKMVSELAGISTSLKFTWLAANAKQYGVTAVQFQKMLEPDQKKTIAKPLTKKRPEKDPVTLFNFIKAREKK